VGIADHVSVGDGAMVAAQGGVPSDSTPGALPRHAGAARDGSAADLRGGVAPARAAAARARAGARVEALGAGPLGAQEDAR